MVGYVHFVHFCVNVSSGPYCIYLVDNDRNSPLAFLDLTVYRHAICAQTVPSFKCKNCSIYFNLPQALSVVLSLSAIC